MACITSLLTSRYLLGRGLGTSVLRTAATKRSMSGGQSGPLVSIAKDSTNDKVRVLTLNRPPVNSLNLELLQELIKAIDHLETEAKETELDGLIINSSSKSVFCAGLDLTEMLNPDQERLREFWRNLQEFWIRLYGCQLTVASALTGHAPAAGTLIACCSDFRVMTDNPKLTIGLNETKFGLAASYPPLVKDKVKRPFSWVRCSSLRLLWRLVWWTSLARMLMIPWTNAAPS